MKIRDTRKSAIKSLRRRELADFLEALGRSEEAFNGIEIDLIALQDQIVSIKKKLGSEQYLGEWSAGNLEVGLANRECLFKDLAELKTKETMLQKNLKKTGAVLDAMKDTVARAKKALCAIEDDDGRLE